MNCSSPGSSVPGILQARILEWVAISSSRGILPIQGWKLLCIRQWQAGSLPLVPPGKPRVTVLGQANFNLLCSQDVPFLLSSIEVLGLGSVCVCVLRRGGGKCPCKKRHGLRAFVSGAGCLAFLMSKYVLFKETNKQSKNIYSSGFYSFVLNTNKRREETWLFLQQLFQMQLIPSLQVFQWCLSP